jgi:integrase
VRCYRSHAEDDPAIGQLIKPRKLGRRAAEDAAEAARRTLPPGLEPKTVVNTHLMLHRAWEDFAAWGWAKRNVVSDARPPRVPRKGRKVWTVAQLQTFLQHARSDRFFALWVLEATSGMRRCERAGARRDLLDLGAGTLAIEVTRVVVDGRVVESDGKTENAQHVLALDPFTLAALKEHVAMLDRERAEFGPDYQDHGVLFCWENGKPPHPDTITRRFKRLAAAAGLPEIDLHDVRHSYATAGQRRGVASDATFREKREDTRPALQLPQHSRRAGRSASKVAMTCDVITRLYQPRRCCSHFCCIQRPA